MDLVSLIERILSVVGVGAIALWLYRWHRESRQKHAELASIDKDIRNALREAFEAQRTLRAADRERLDQAIATLQISLEEAERKNTALGIQNTELQRHYEILLAVIGQARDRLAESVRAFDKDSTSLVLKYIADIASHYGPLWPANHAPTDEEMRAVIKGHPALRNLHAMTVRGGSFQGGVQFVVDIQTAALEVAADPSVGSVKDAIAKIRNRTDHLTKRESP